MRDQARAHDQLEGLPQSESFEKDIRRNEEARKSDTFSIRAESGAESESGARTFTGKRSREDGEDEDDQGRVPPSAPWPQDGALPVLPLAGLKHEQNAEGMSGVIDAATAAALAGGADADTAAAMSASIAAMMADPAMSAMAAAAMADPSNPANLQALAQLAQGGGADQGLSALVAAAVGMAAMENPAGGAPSLPNVNLNGDQLSGLNIPADFDFGAFIAQNPTVFGSVNFSANEQDQDQDQEDGAQPLNPAPHAPRGRGRPRKNPLPDGTTPPVQERTHAAPSINWMRKFHEFAYGADKATLEAAKTNSSLITLQVEWSNMPEEVVALIPSGLTAPVEVPSDATVVFLKRTISRSLGGNLYPSVLRLPSGVDGVSIEITEAGEAGDVSIADFGVVHNSYIQMEAAYYSIPNFGTVSAPVRANNNPSSSAWTLAVGGNSAKGVAKERFTMDEMVNLVEGMERHGIKWAKIHKDYPDDLGLKSQGDLKDKWRNWQRNVHNNWSTARVFMPEDLKARIEKLCILYPPMSGPLKDGLPQRLLDRPYNEHNSSEAPEEAQGQGGDGQSQAVADAYAAAGIDQMGGLEAATAAFLAQGGLPQFDAATLANFSSLDPTQMAQMAAAAASGMDGDNASLLAAAQAMIQSMQGMQGQ